MPKLIKGHTCKPKYNLYKLGELWVCTHRPNTIYMIVTNEDNKTVGTQKAVIVYSEISYNLAGTFAYLPLVTSKMEKFNGKLEF